MKITVKDTKGYMGRTYFAGKRYRLVDREARADDEVHSAHAAQMVAIGMAVAGSPKSESRSRKKKPAAMKTPVRDVKHPPAPAHAAKPAVASQKESEAK